MKQKNDYPALLALARLLLDPQDLERVVLPTLADAMSERPSGRGYRRWRWQSRRYLITAIAYGAWDGALRRLRLASHLPVALLALAGMSGAISSHEALALQGYGAVHLLFIGLGLVVAELAVAAPAPVLRALLWPGFATLAVGLAACPWFGIALEGRRQWLAVGPLNVHVSSLLLPLFALVANRMAARGQRIRLGLIAVPCLGLLAQQPDWMALLSYGAVLGAALLQPGREQTSWLLGLVFVTAGVGVLWRFVPESSPGWGLLGVLLLFVALGSGLIEAASLPDVARPGSAALGVALLAPIALRAWSHESLPVVGFGGSAIVAVFLSAAVYVRPGATVQGGA